MTRRLAATMMVCCLVLEVAQGQGLGKAALDAAPKREFRAAWVATVTNLDWPSPATANPVTQQEQIVALLDALEAMHINVVIFQVRPACDAFYISPYEPSSYWLTGTQGTALSYDPLAYFVREAHRRGMELHAWFNPYRAYISTWHYGLAGNHVINAHPDWILTASSSTQTLSLLNPGLPAVRDHVAKVVADVVRRYDVDGVHMDDYFYPYPEYNFTTQDAQTFADYSRGIGNIADWRRDNVNLLIKQIHDSLQAIKPYVKFGMSPFGIWKNGVPPGITGLDAYSTIYCDAIAWLQQGSIDYLTPQLYWKIGGSQDYATLMPWWADSAAANGRHLYPGHILSSGFTTSELPNQVRFDRSNPKVGGSVFFRSSLLVENTLGFRDTLKANLYRYAAIPPVMNWKDTIKPNAPQNLRFDRIAGAVSAGLQWDLPSTASDGDTAARYVVYRFDHPSVQPSDLDDPANILLATADRVNKPPVPSTEGPFYFVLTALDHNQNESGIAGPLLISPPAAPTLFLPADMAVDQPPVMQVQWFGSNDASYFHLQVSADSAFAVPAINVDGLEDTSRVITGLEGQKTYYWRVGVSNPGGVGSFSSLRTFSTGFPATPLPSLPGNYLTNIPLDVTFQWQPTPGAQSYHFQLATNSNFSPALVDTVGLTDTLYAVNGLQLSKIYFWRLNATNAVGTGLWSELWRFRTVTATLVAEDDQLPREYELSQNYPNPFNASTKIRFSVIETAPTSLRVYDLLGREVAVLVDDELEAGTYTFTFDAKDLSSGTYIYVFRSGVTRILKKMLLLK